MFQYPTRRYDQEFAPQSRQDKSAYDENRRSYVIDRMSQSSAVHCPTHFLSYDRDAHRLGKENECIATNSLRIEFTFTEVASEEFRNQVVDGVIADAARHGAVKGMRQERPVKNTIQIWFDLQKDVTPHQAEETAKELTTTLKHSALAQVSEFREHWGYGWAQLGLEKSRLERVPSHHNGFVPVFAPPNLIPIGAGVYTPESASYTIGKRSNVAVVGCPEPDYSRDIEVIDGEEVEGRSFKGLKVGVEFFGDDKGFQQEILHQLETSTSGVRYVRSVEQKPMVGGTLLYFHLWHGIEAEDVNSITHNVTSRVGRKAETLSAEYAQKYGTPVLPNKKPEAMGRVNPEAGSFLDKS